MPVLLAAAIPGCSGTHLGVGVRRYPWGDDYGRGPYYGPGWGRTVVVPAPDLGMPDFAPMDMGEMDMGGFDF